MYVCMNICMHVCVRILCKLCMSMYVCYVCKYGRMPAGMHAQQYVYNSVLRESFNINNNNNNVQLMKKCIRYDRLQNTRYTLRQASEHTLYVTTGFRTHAIRPLIRMFFQLSITPFFFSTDIQKRGNNNERQVCYWYCNTGRCDLDGRILLKWKLNTIWWESQWNFGLHKMRPVLDDNRKHCSREWFSCDISTNNVVCNDMTNGNFFLCVKLWTRSSVVLRSFYALHIMRFLVNEAHLTYCTEWGWQRTHKDFM
jgi:hypothetical protein